MKRGEKWAKKIQMFEKMAAPFTVTSKSAVGVEEPAS